MSDLPDLFSVASTPTCCDHHAGWADAPECQPETVTVVLSVEDFRFATEYDPERERSASRRDMVTVLEEIQALLRDNQVND